MGKTNWKLNDAWGLKEFVFLMLLEFVFVLGCIKFVVEPLYARWFNNDLYAGTLMGMTIAITLLLGVYFIALHPKRLSFQEVGLKSFHKKDWKIIIWFTLFTMAGVVLFAVIVEWMGDTVDNHKTASLMENMSFFTIVIAFISAAIISPIYEEIFYRGFIYRWLRTRLGVTEAVVLSSLIFTAAHIPTFNVMPVNFFGGVLFALAYEKTNSVVPSMIIHGLSNGIMVLLASAG